MNGAFVLDSKPDRLSIRLSDIGYFEPERLIRASAELLSKGMSSVQARLVLVWLTFAASPISFEDLGTAIRHISGEHRASVVLPNQICDEELAYEDLQSILTQFHGLIVWDRGNHLIKLSSNEAGKVVRSLWFSAYQPSTILPSVSGLGILGRICIYCIQYMFSIPLEVINTCSEREIYQLLQRYSFLSHAVLN